MADRAAGLLADLEAALGSDAVLTAKAERWPYGYDNSRRHELPLCVVLPRDHAGVADCVQLAAAASVPITARGLGTGTAGAAVPTPGGLVLCTQRLDRLDIDAPNRVAVCGAGVTNGALQRAAAEQGFFWPPDPTSADYSTIGGNLACNSAGPRAIKYGTPRENTLGLTAVTGSAATLKTGCYTTKGVVGYDLTRLLIGSEGTLALITEANLKLWPVPAAIRCLRISYSDMAAAADAVSRIMAQPVIPRVLEFMDGAAIAMIRDYAETDLPADAGALLICEVEGEAAQLDAATQAIRAASEATELLEFRAAHDAAETQALWAARKALSPALRRVAPKKINEDVVVPVAKMAEFIARLAELSAEHEIRIVNFGHAGNGNIHVNLLSDPDDTAQQARAQRCLADVFRNVLDFGGTLSGEHGIGYDKREFVGLEIEPATLALMRDLKVLFDPRGILNPDKVFPTPI